MMNCVTHVGKMSGYALHVTKRTPRPYPDATQLQSYHYLKNENTPTHYEEGSPRETDDYKSRVQLQKHFFVGKINCGDSEKIEEFSLIDEYLEHLNYQHRNTEKVRSQEKHQARSTS